MPLADIKPLIQAGKIVNGPTLIGVLHTEDYHRRCVGTALMEAAKERNLQLRTVEHPNTLE